MGIDAIAAHSLDEDELMETATMPVGGVLPFLIAAFWMLREIEMAAMAWRDVIINVALQTVPLTLAISNTDPEAKGCERSWGCLCLGDDKVPCPYHSFNRPKKKLAEKFGRQPEDDDAVFINSRGKPCLKGQLVKYLVALAVALAALETRARQVWAGTLRALAARASSQA